MNKWTIFLFVFCISMFFVDAQEVTTVYKYSEQGIFFTQPCFSETSSDGLCPSSTICSITITDNNNIIVNNGNATIGKGYINYTITNVTTPSIYRASIGCSDSNITGFTSLYFGVTESGYNYSSNYLMFFLIFIMLSLLALFITLAIKLNNGLAHAFLLLTFVILAIIFWLGLTIVNNSFVNLFIISMINTGYWLSLLLLLVMSLYSLWVLTMNLKIRKNRPKNPALPKDHTVNWRVNDDDRR